MREQKQKIKISLLDLRKFVGVDRFRLIDTVFGNKNTYPRLNYFSSEPVQGFRMVGSIVFPSSVFARILLHERLEMATFQLSSTIRRQDFCRLWTGFLFEERGKPFSAFSFPLLAVFHPFPKQRACSQAKTFAPGNSQANLVSSPSVVFKVIKGVYICSTDNFFLY